MAGSTGAPPVRAGVIGCGWVAGRYVRSLQPYPQIEIAGVADCLPEKAAVFAEKHGLRAYESVAGLLADDRVELVVDLSAATAHAQVVADCLDAGKHVFCEKPLALDYEGARKLVTLAAEKGLRLASAPVSFMGESQQTVAGWLREGRLGRIRLAYAELNHGRVESWHPSPVPFYECGLLFDVGPYPLTLLASLFGPAKQVEVISRVLLPERRLLDGTPFSIEKPDFVLALVEYRSGPVARLTVCGYADWFKKQGESMEFHGDAGSLYLSHSGRFDAAVEYAEFNKTYEPLALVREPSGLDPLSGMEYARGIVELVSAMREGRPHRTSGEMAAHVIETMDAIYRSLELRKPVGVTSTFTPPAPMEWAGGPAT